ncbi:hypothetical protein HQ524_03805 [Candidatus Uhrbacteria bacterium]|nr:hypothetical protein [Candidatus Uhrbacteria bacterium]
MELSFLLGKVIAVYLVIVGLMFISRRDDIHEIMKKFKKNSVLLFGLGAAVILLGLFVILNHNIWVSDWRVIITILGWLALIRGLASWFLPEGMVRLGNYLSKRGHFLIVGLVVLMIGLFLGYNAFGLAL